MIKCLLHCSTFGPDELLLVLGSRRSASVKAFEQAGTAVIYLGREKKIRFGQITNCFVISTACLQLISLRTEI